MKDNESIPSNTHLQKEMFLLLKETVFSKVHGYEFIPYYYGPFSRELDTDITELVSSGYVNDEDGFILTPVGFRNARALWNNLDRAHKIAISRIKERYNRLTSETLIDYVYGKYKKYTVKSAIKLDNLYKYFNEFTLENDITPDDLDKAFNRIRHPENENRN